MDKITEKSELTIRSEIRNALLDNTCKDGKTGCMIWKGGKDKSGYGICNFNNKSKRVHRIMMLLTGCDISGKKVAHCCGIAGCCNPDHLFFPASGRKCPEEPKRRKISLYGNSRYKVSSARVRSARESGR